MRDFIYPHNGDIKLINAVNLTKKESGYFERKLTEILQVNAKDSTIYNTQSGSNMTGTDLCVNKPHCAAAVRP